MKQVVQSARTGKLALKDVPEPTVRDGELLVRTTASLISAGTERMVVSFAKKSLAGKARARPDLVKKTIDKAKRDGIKATMQTVAARLDEPLPLGYSAAGTVIEVGAGLEGRFSVGQRVAVAGAGLANHAEINAVPGNLAVPMPNDVNDEEACFGTVAAIALHAVRNLDVELGDVVAVIGVGLVGQLAVEFLDLAGIRVIAIDYDSKRLELARYGGAEQTFALADGDPTVSIDAVTDGLGCDAVLIAAATESSEPFDLAASIARDRARVCLVGHTGTEVPYRAFMEKELSLVVSRSYGPGRYDDDYERRGMKYPPGFVRWTETRNLAHAVRMMSRRRDRRLAVEQLITHRFPIDQAEDAYRLVTAGEEPHLAVVLRYPEPVDNAVSKLRVPRHVSAVGSKSEKSCVLGVIGAGNFARSVLLPALQKLPACRLHTVSTARGISADHARAKFGFENATATDAEVIADPDVNAVLIATTHSTHAALTVDALAAEKHVLVEKPLALSRDELNDVVKRRSRSSAFFLVGFNRRFAPMAEKAKDTLASLGGRKVLSIRVNAGALPADHWINAPEEGHGRILGELCHFVDLARFLVDAPIADIRAAAASSTEVCENVTVTIGFSDGSLATIVYTALGDSSASKERIECYAGGGVAVIEDFRRMSITVNGKTTQPGRSIDQGKGHVQELEAFVRAVSAGGPPPVDETELIESSLATIAILESLRSGTPITL